MARTSETEGREGGTSRRDALKLGGLAAIGSVAASLASEGSAGAVLRSAAISGHRFSLEIDGVLVAGVHSIDAMDSVSDVAFATSVGGGVSAQPGAITDQSIRVGKDWSGTKEFIEWRKTVIDGKVDRKSISVIFQNDAGQEVARINLFNCWPSMYQGPALNAKSSGHATETITLVYETFELKAG